MFEDAWPGRHRLERVDAANAVVVDDDQLAGLDVALVGRADDVQGHAFGGEDHRLAQAAHDQRADAERVPASNHALTRQADERISALDLLERIDEPIEQRAIARFGDEVDNHLGIAGGLEDRSIAHQPLAQRHRVGDVAIMGDGEAA